MNPGTWVMGGGGSGGGGSGGGSGGGGKGGANGQDGKGDPNGGGKGAGACGQGTPGACTNCSHQVAAGDPVDVITGEVFTLPTRDLFLPGRFALEFIRSYGSARRRRDVGLGYGWCHGLAWKLRVGRRELELITGDGREVPLPKLEEGETRFVGTYTLMRGKGLYIVYPGDEFAHVFREVEPGSDTYELGWVRYRNRGHLALEYDAGRLVRVTDTVGRVVHFDGTRDGRISAVSVAAPNGRRIVFARYAYDDAGNLVEAIDADGNVTRYRYGEDHELTSFEYPNGLRFHFSYDRQGRCVETWGEYPGGHDPALAEGLPALLADGSTRAKGIYHSRLDFLDDEVVEVADSLRVRRFFRGAGGKVAKAVGGRSNVTTRTFDEDQNCIEQTDATDATWRWEYDRQGNVTRGIDPLGNETRIERNIFGQETSITDEEGATTKLERDTSGELSGVIFADGAEQQLVRDARGSVVEATDARGGVHRMELDAHANRVSRTFPNGARYTFEYDFWGRLLRETDPTGAERRYTYSDRGLVTSATDRLGRMRQFDYDGMGNCVREIEPDGSSHSFEYGGLNWLCRSRWADGSEVLASYDREGLILQLSNERGEPWQYEYDGDGLVFAERDFAGRRTRYGRDALGRITTIETSAGKLEYVRDASGLVIQSTAPDDSVRTYRYDRCGRLVHASGGSASFEWRRDAVGRIVREELACDGRSYVIENDYEVGGPRRRLKTSLGYELETSRDVNGSITELRANGDRTLAFTRNELGQAVRRDYAGGGALFDRWDAETQLRQRIVVSAGADLHRGEPEWVGSARPGSKQWLYDYTQVGELLQVSESPGRELAFTYDLRRRVTERRDDRSSEAFSYDPTSNVYERGEGAQQRRYERGDLLVARGETAYIYDERGFLIAKRDASAELEAVTHYSWNGWGLLEAVETPDGTRVEFTYDPFARRLAKRTLRDGKLIEAHDYVWDLVSMVHDVAERHGAAAEVTTYLFADNDDGIPLGERPGATSGRFSHYVSDFNGTPREIVDDTGRSIGVLERTTFGRMAALAGSSLTTPFRFPGQFSDSETGLHYNRYRYYDPDVGRYISPDPIGLAGGSNLYAYCVNPIAWTDPDGLQHALGVSQRGGAVQLAPNLGRPNPAGGANYHAGQGSTRDTVNRSPPLLPNTPELNHPQLYHSEQRFAHDLITQARQNPNGFQNARFRLRGERPPCPTCHGAMMRAAQESGADINYHWGDPTQTIRYQGGSGNPRARGADARALLGAYDHKATNWTQGQTALPGETGFARIGAGPGTSGQPGTRDAWGYNISSGAWAEYYRQST